jgi:hypothetical protein
MPGSPKEKNNPKTTTNETFSLKYKKREKSAKGDGFHPFPIDRLDLGGMKKRINF